MKNLQNEKIRKILVILKHNQIGDLIVSTPMFFSLKKCFPEASISILASPTNYTIPFKEIIPYLDKIILLNRKTLKQQIEILKNLRKDNYDLAIIPSTIRFSITSIIISYLAKIKYRVGISGIDEKKTKFNFLLNIKKHFKWETNKTHQIFRNLDVVEQIGCKITIDEIFKSFPLVTLEENQKAKSLIENYFGHCELIIGIHPGAGQLQNIWNTENYIRVIKELNQKYKCGFIITAGYTDDQTTKCITNKLKNLKINFLLAQNYEFKNLMSLINQCDLFISNDTGVMHIASLTKTNLIALMRKEKEFDWRPLAANKFYIVSKSNLIDDISIDQVLDLSQKIIKLIMYKRKLT